MHDASDVLYERVPGREGDLGREEEAFLLMFVFFLLCSFFVEVLERWRRKRGIDRVVDAAAASAVFSLRHADSDGVHVVTALRESAGLALSLSRRAKREQYRAMERKEK